MIQNEILNGELLLYIMNGIKTKLIIKNGNIIFSVSSLENQNDSNYNLTIIDLGECEGILRDKYDLRQNETFFIFKKESFIDGLLFPIVEYELYTNKIKSKLNMEFCKDKKINMNFKVSINENNLYKYDPSNNYYNDICFSSTTEDNTDIILLDRKKEFNNNNLSLCESNCIYKGYNSQTKSSSCDCDIKTELSFFSEIINNKFEIIEKFNEINSNINVIRCYYTLFNMNGLIYNIGSYFILIIIFIEFILMIFFKAKEYNKFIKNIKKNFINSNEKKNSLKLSNSNINNIGKKEIKTNKTHKNKSYKNIENIVETQSNRSKIKLLNVIKNIKNTNYNNKKTKNKSRNKILGIKINLPQREIINQSIINNNKGKIEKKKLTIIKYNDFELNNFSYKKALKLDKRNYFHYYLSLLKYNQLLIFTFYTNNDYNSKIIKISLFLFLFSLYYTINTLFFNNESIHNIYKNKGKYDFLFQIPQIIYSSIISSLIKIIISYFSLTEKDIIQIKEKEEKKDKNITKLIKCLLVKFILFYILTFLFLILFWYYLACFCAVYKNSQVHVIKDTLASFSISQMYPLGLSLLPGIFRIISLKEEKECLYKFSKLLQLI